MTENDAVVFPAPGDVELREQPRPVAGPGEVVVETERSLVSTGTELTILSGSFPEDSQWAAYGQYPFVAGYCNVGRVVETGEGIEGESVDLAVGDRVATRTPHQRYVVADAEDAITVPAGVDAEWGAFFGLASITMNGVRRGEPTWGDAVAIFGCGLLGQLAVRWCREAGARPVVAVEPAAPRRAMLPDDPAVVAVDPETDDPAAVVRDANHGRLADVVFEVTGVPDVIAGEFDALRDLGRLVVLSSPRGVTTLDLHDHCNAPGYEIVGAHERTEPPTATLRDPWSARRNVELFFDLLADGVVDVEGLVTHRPSPDEAPGVYRSLLDDRSAAMGVVIDWTG